MAQTDEVKSPGDKLKDLLEKVEANELRARDAEARLRIIEAELKLIELRPRLAQHK
jgi:hypothetical protein